jgi:hypothetical protein
MAYISASDLTKMMMDYLKDNGNEVWRNNNLAVRGRAFIGRKGVPDIIGYSKKYGHFVCCEIKAIGDRLSSDQMVFLEQIATAGGISMLCQQIRDESITVKIYKENGESEDWKFDKGCLHPYGK